jgi:putative Mg2+ transporter-C (MgtC) family protein
MSIDLDASIVVRLLLSSLLGALIGLEREIHGRPAGFRTHLLVSLGSCLYVIASIDFYRAYGNFSGAVAVGVDPGRVAAQVVTGIGFLGAGAIIKEKASIRGLTTAACLWVAAAVGLACGAGIYGPAMMVTGLALASLLLLKKVEDRLSRDTYVLFRVWSADVDGQKERLERLIAECNLQLVGISIERNLAMAEAYYEFQLKSRARELTCRLVDTVHTIDGIKRVRLD